MELSLDYVWVVAAITSACLWLRPGRRTLVSRRLSVVGLFPFIVILFPAISIRDDLRSIQNPAQTKTFQLRDQRENRPHSAFTAIAALPEPAVVHLSLGFQRLGVSPHARFSLSTTPPLAPSRIVLLLGHDRTSSMIQILVLFLTDVAVRNTA
jgi:hypothetical protein